MYNVLFQKQTEWTNAQNLGYFEQYAKDLGLDSDKLKQEVSDKKFEQVIRTDRADGEALKINSTPTFFLNGEMMVGIPKFEDLKSKIDEKLK
jgi:protein-disulfide isomerase